MQYLKEFDDTKDIIITIPKTISWDDYQKEIDEGVFD